MGALQRIKEYCKYSTIHGLQFITEDDRHWTERACWTIGVMLCVWGTINIATSSYEEYRDHSVSFVVETTYLNWNTSFPAFTVCENEDKDKIWDLYAKYPPGTPLTFEKILEEIVYYRGSCAACISCNKTIKKQFIDCSAIFNKSNFEVLFKCEDIFEECFWNNKPFNCCANFLPMITEKGTCFTINSIHTRDSPNKIQMISNRTTGPGILHLKFYEPAWLYIHSPTDVVTRNHWTKMRWLVKFGKKLTVKFQVTEIQNDPLLHTIPIERRDCRFPNEKPGCFTIFHYYSYSTCAFQCRVDKMLELCNCVPHLWHPAVCQVNVSICDVQGLICLDQYTDMLMKLGTLDEEDEERSEGIVCNCNADCDEPDYFILHHIYEKPENEDDSEVYLVMHNLPTERLRRNVVRTNLDLVVSLGGTAGLFLGASLISVAEIFIHAFIRNCRKKNERLNSHNIPLKRKLETNEHLK